MKMSHIITFWATLFLVSGWTLGEVIYLGDGREFQPGDQVIYENDCVVGPIVSNLVILPDSFQCRRFQDQKWTWPRKSGASVSMPVEFPEEFSFEFTASTFTDGCPYVSLQFHPQKQRDILDTGITENISKGLARAIISCSDASFGSSIEPTDWDNTIFRVEVTSMESHRIAIQVRHAQLDFFLDERHVASQPFRPSEPIVAFSLFFNRKFEAMTSYPEAPALVADFRIAAYSQKARGLIR